MAAIKTPGVYIQEQNAFPNAVVAVATAVPAFIGYTEKAEHNGSSLTNVPWRITSMVEYVETFGGPQVGTFHVTEIDTAAKTSPAAAFRMGGKDYAIQSAARPEERFLLYPSMALFFANGGGPCYVVSVGSYGDAPISLNALRNGIDLLEKEQEPTMVVVPDAVYLPTAADCFTLQQHALLHCGETMRSRIALLDIYGGYFGRNDLSGDCVQSFRDNIGVNYLDFAAAYYPWLDTTALTDKDVTYKYVDTADLVALLKAEAALPTSVRHVGTGVIAEVAALSKLTAEQLNVALTNGSEVFPQVIAEALRQLNRLPPCAAIAGVYTFVDGSQGVWKAPANVSLSAVSSPTVAISAAEQQDLNAALDGKAVNAIRSFADGGVLVWGARTLDANSQDWRYIQVRRTMIMLEQSIQLASKAYVFDDNVSTTWVTIKSMIGNFLTGVWQQGGLVGARAEDAFSVSCGVGETMTAQDILDGVLRVTVQVAVVHPAEFIEITFQQQMQKS
jgi:phage tail sheath protein FI